MVNITHSWEKRGTATLKDVARSVGVSESVASVVLNGSRSHTRVSASTRERVNEAAKLLGYRPNAVAKALLSGKTNRIGIYASHYVDDFADPIWGAIHAGLFKGAREFNVDIVIHTACGQAGRMMEMLSDRAIDGLLLIVRADDPVLALLEERRVPAVAIVDRCAGIPSVCVDDYAGGRMLAEHLYDRGHRHTLVLTWRSVTSRASAGRAEGFCERARELGMQATLDKQCDGFDPSLNEEHLRMLTEGDNPVTAIMARSDCGANQICEQLHKLGIDIPAQVAVVGFDGHTTYFEPKQMLTSIQANWVEVARVGVQNLMSLVNGQQVNMLTELPVTFLQGATT